MREKNDFEKRIERCFQSNDVRCIYGKELDEDMVYRTGRALVNFLKCREVFVGRDMRCSSESLFNALAKGIREQGADVVNVGMVDTPAVYFASGFFGKPGAMITASHNPVKYNGIKLVKSGSEPIGEGTGLKKIKEKVKKGTFPEPSRKGRLTKKDLTSSYRKHVLSFIEKNGLKKLKIVVDAGRGMAGKTIPEIYGGLKINLIKQNFEFEGKDPNHAANPAVSGNLKNLQKKVISEKADAGMAFDSDMDRVFFVDEKGQILNSSVTGSLIIKNVPKNEKTKFIYSLICSKVVPETIKKLGARAIKTKVGHSHIKRKMKETGSKFAVELSGHFYYSDNYFADSGVITSLILLEILSESNRPLSELAAEFRRYSKTGETNFRVKDKRATLKKIESHYVKKRPEKIEHFDGLTVEFGNFWFNARASRTEPFLRVNLEADDGKTMKKEMSNLGKLIRSF